MTSSTIPATAKALMLDLNTDTVSAITHPVPVPKPNSDENLIRVHATAFCARELVWPKFFPTPADKELIPGYDLAGTIVIPAADSLFRPGDEVYCRTSYARAGCARDYTIALTSELALKPKNLDWVNAATVPLSALTAWQALFYQGGLSQTGSAGKRVLVTAAAGGVGVWVVQLAKWAGMEVIGTCGPDNMEFIKGLGAAEAVNYRTTSLKDWAAGGKEKVDLVIDCIGGQSLEDSWYCVKDGGVLVSIFEPPENKRPADCAGKDVRNLFFIMVADGQQLKEITDLLEQEKVKPVLDSVWEFDDFKKAFEQVDGGHARGKVVLKVT